ncbi:MAG: hypothetical protein LW809_04875 [Vampirovibrionales bacterium]|jgi:hypothetical protein|nr:hypothetical protein [Vampirovibrionales bacterium]
MKQIMAYSLTNAVPKNNKMRQREGAQITEQSFRTLEHFLNFSRLSPNVKNQVKGYFQSLQSHVKADGRDGLHELAKWEDGVQINLKLTDKGHLEISFKASPEIEAEIEKTITAQKKIHLFFSDLDEEALAQINYIESLMINRVWDPRRGQDLDEARAAKCAFKKKQKERNPAEKAKDWLVTNARKWLSNH